jgi:hypothetical protein
MFSFITQSFHRHLALYWTEQVGLSFRDWVTEFLVSGILRCVTE